MTDSIAGLPERSILYISANVHASHPMHRVVRDHLDPLPDLDLSRISRALGPWVRRYFADRVIDATSEELPVDLSMYRGVVLGCSAHSVNTERNTLAPWQSRLVDFVRRAVIDADLPYLGLCGGGQIGLVALGGAVRQNPPGVGFTPDRPGSLVVRTTEVRLTDAGRRDPLFVGCPPSLGINALHSEYLAELPSGHGWRALAHADDVPNQVVAFGDKVRLFGLHPELTFEFLQETASAVVQANGFAQVPRDDLLAAFARMKATLHANTTVLRNFLSRICASPIDRHDSSRLQDAEGRQPCSTR
jgi:GMP synthase (glutamine-hydrolysing)